MRTRSHVVVNLMPMEQLAICHLLQTIGDLLMVQNIVMLHSHALGSMLRQVVSVQLGAMVDVMIIWVHVLNKRFVMMFLQIIAMVGVQVEIRRGFNIGRRNHNIMVVVTDNVRHEVLTLMRLLFFIILLLSFAWLWLLGFNLRSAEDVTDFNWHSHWIQKRSIHIDIFVSVMGSVSMILWQGVVHAYLS